MCFFYLVKRSYSYYHSDRKGSTLALSDDAGTITDLYQYDEFGVPSGSSGNTPNPFRYLGSFGVYDNGDGTLFARARHYHPDLGRFLSRDALFGTQDNGQSLNRYVYALNDPVDMADASGFVATDAFCPLFYEEAINSDSKDYDLAGYIPVYGSARDSIRAYKEERYLASVTHGVFAITDIVPVKAVAMMGVKVGIKKAGQLFAKEVIEQLEAKGGTYLLRDVAGNIVRIGRTNNLARRGVEHARELREFIFEVVHRTDDYFEQRGLEQLLYDNYMPVLNKIRPIALKNPKLNVYINAALDYLKK